MDGHQNNDFLRDITSLGDRKAIVSTRDVRAGNGIKLVGKNTRIDSGVFVKLANHKLQTPIEACLSIEDPLTSSYLLVAVQALAAPNSMRERIVDRLPSEALEILIETICRLTLSPQLAFRLAVMRDQRQDLFRHSLQTALNALLIQVLDPGDGVTPAEAFMAGLVHDIGKMHIDPTLWSDGTRLSGEQRRFIYVHPVTGHAVLKADRSVKPKVALAVLEHHERLDGSGFPRAISGTDISELGQLLAIAEVVSTLLFRDGGIKAPLELSIVLRFCHGKFNLRYANFAHSLLGKVPVAGGRVAVGDAEDIFSKLKPLVDCLRAWFCTQDGGSADNAPQPEPLIDLIELRCLSLKRNLASVGIDIDDWEAFVQRGDFRAQALPEIETITRELAYQLSCVILEIERRVEQAPWADMAARDRAKAWMDTVAGALATGEAVA